MNDVYATRIIKLKDGFELTIEMKKEFLEKLKNLYELESIDSVSDMHIKHFLSSTVQNAIDKN